jgi:amino acid permease
LSIFNHHTLTLCTFLFFNNFFVLLFQWGCSFCGHCEQNVGIRIYLIYKFTSEKNNKQQQQQQQQQQPTHVNKSKDFHLTEGRGFDFWKSFGSFEAPEVSIGGFGLSLAAFGNAVHGSTACQYHDKLL